MAYNALTIGLPDELFTALQSLTGQHDLALTASFTVQEAGRLLGQQAFHLLIVDLDYLRSIGQIEWLINIRRISFAPVVVLSNTPEQDVKSMVQLGADMCISGKRPYSMIVDLAYAQLRRYTEYNHYNDPASAETAPFRVPKHRPSHLHSGLLLLGDHSCPVLRKRLDGFLVAGIIPRLRPLAVFIEVHAAVEQQRCRFHSVVFDTGVKGVVVIGGYPHPLFQQAFRYTALPTAGLSFSSSFS